MQDGLDLPILRDGHLGVDIFFVLSGFVLAFAYPNSDWSWATYRRFLVARVARIFPTHIAAMATLVVIVAFYPGFVESFGLIGAERFSLVAFFRTVFLVQNWWLWQPLPWNAPAWSLSAEWMVSLGFPIILLATRLVSGRNAIVAAVLGMLTWALILYARGTWSPGVVGPWGQIRIMFEFSVGCLLPRLISGGVKIGWAGSFLSVVLLMFGLYSHDLIALTVITIPIFIILSTQEDSVVYYILTKSILQFIGNISYSLYLFHWPLLQVWNLIFETVSMPAYVAILSSVIFMIVSIVIAMLSFVFIEVPMQAWVRAALGYADGRRDRERA